MEVDYTNKIKTIQTLNKMQSKNYARIFSFLGYWNFEIHDNFKIDLQDFYVKGAIVNTHAFDFCILQNFISGMKHYFNPTKRFMHKDKGMTRIWSQPPKQTGK